MTVIPQRTRVSVRVKRSCNDGGFWPKRTENGFILKKINGLLFWCQNFYLVLPQLLVNKFSLQRGRNLV